MDLALTDTILTIEQIIRQKHLMKLKKKYFFELKNYESNRYETDDDAEERFAAAEEKFFKRERKRRRTESHAHQDRVIAWYKANCEDESFFIIPFQFRTSCFYSKSVDSTIYNSNVAA